MADKGCPWCGQKPTIGKGQRRKTSSPPDSPLTWKAGDWIWRPSINHGRGKTCGVYITIEADSVEELVRIWNTRKVCAALAAIESKHE